MKWLPAAGSAPAPPPGVTIGWKMKTEMHLTSQKDTFLCFLLKFTLATFLLATAFGVFVTLLWATVMGS